MTAVNLLAISGIALLDSLNPTLFVGILYILTTWRAGSRSVSFIAGVVITNFLGGLLLAAGLHDPAVALFRGVSDAIWAAIEIALGLALVGFGLFYSAGADRSTQLRRRPSDGVAGPFVFGAIMTMKELPTALPYFVAIALMGRAGFSQAETLFALVVYNIVFAVPLIGFLVAYMVMRQRFAGFASTLSAWVDFWSRRILKYGSLILGAALIGSAALRILQ